MLRCILPLLLTVVMGCGDGRVKLPTALVTGAVTYQGRPLKTGRVVFFHPTGQAVGADLAADGTFTLAAFQGNNQIAVECYEPGATSTGRFGMRPKSLIPDRYTNYSTSGLALEVKPGQNDRAEFTLKD